MANRAANEEVDVIIIGGGGSGAVLAARLSAARPDLDIAVLERGAAGLHDPVTSTPALFITRLRETSDALHYIKSKPSKQVNGRSIVVPTGKRLGGGTAVNVMLYSRAAACDFDSWQQPGWTAKDLLPLFRRSEDYQIEGADPRVHGFDGPLKVSYSWSFPIGNEYLQAAKEDGAVEHDMADWEFEGESSMGPAPKWINRETGKRSDVASAYLVPQMENPRLHILTESTVQRILFDGDKASGVEYVKEGDETKRILKARRLVVSSAGALETPLLLERSGIGGAELLNRLGIPVLVDLPGVGEEYHDHPHVMTSYYASDDCETQDSYWQDLGDARARAEEQYKSGTGPLATNAREAAARWRPSATDLEKLRASSSAFEEHWDKHFATYTGRTLMLRTVSAVYSGPPDGIPKGTKCFSNTSYMGFPASFGHVHLSSADPDAPPDFDTGILTHDADIVAHIWAYKRGREVARRQRSYRGEVQAMHPRFPEGSAAACRRHAAAPRDVQNLVYTKEDDAAIDDFIRDRINTAWHGMCTTPMRSRSQSGVVDAKLQVYGVRHLMIADIGICPGPATANLMSVAVMIGEKAADLVIEDLSDY